MGLPGLVYEKRVNGHVMYVEEVRTGARTFAAKTMYKKKIAEGEESAGATTWPFTAPLVIRPKRFPALCIIRTVASISRSRGYDSARGDPMALEGLRSYVQAEKFRGMKVPGRPNGPERAPQS